MPKPSPALTEMYRKNLRLALGPSRRSGSFYGKRMGVLALSAGLTVSSIITLHARLLYEQFHAGVRSVRLAQRLRSAGDFLAAVLVGARHGGDARSAPIDDLRPLFVLFGAHIAELASVKAAMAIAIGAAKTKVALGAERNRESLRRSRDMHRQLRLLSRRLLTAHEDERRMISRDLHEVVAQTLAGINLRLAALRREASIDSADHGRHIAQAQRLVVRSVNRVNRFARELRPAILDDLGLLPALQSLATATGQRTGLRVALSSPATLGAFTPLVRTVVYRVVQEAVDNAAKHADATAIDIAITVVAGGIRLVVHDDGKTFDVDSTKRQAGGGHLGILAMRERVEMVDGSFSITSTPGVGTTISATIPAAG